MLTSWGVKRERAQRKRDAAIDARVEATVRTWVQTRGREPSQREIAMRCGVSRSVVERSLARLAAPVARIETALAELERTGAADLAGDERATILGAGRRALADFPDLADVAAVAPGILDSLFDLDEQSEREGAIVALAASTLCTAPELARSLRLACGSAALEVAEAALVLLRKEDAARTGGLRKSAGPDTERPPAAGDACPPVARTAGARSGDGAAGRAKGAASPPGSGRASGAHRGAEARKAPRRPTAGRATGAPSSTPTSSRRARS